MKRLCLTIMAVASTVSACQEPVADYDEIHLLNLWPVDVWLFAVEEEPEWITMSFGGRADRPHIWQLHLRL